ncbi:PIG-L family deacetylase [Oceanobacillus massiliensis]|uniref:PIG-L deacetylase family protein n=1 Tax=Oceanobacillus massiliensis TaxID=1465765 RepID=UPI00301B5CFF
MNLKNLIIKLMRPLNVPITKFILKRHYSERKQLSTNEHAERILILAPHMDDETIGPGGTIKKHAKNGAEIHCVFITDGSNSVSDLSKEELIRARKEEIEVVKDILGIKQVHYFSLPDGKVESNETSQQMLLELIKQIDPDIIYSTLFIDAHPDHTATAEILADTTKKIKNPRFLVRLYEINCAIPPKYVNCVADISSTIGDKMEAMDKFVSQAIAFDGFITLNMLKKHLVAKEESVKATEVFLELDSKSLISHRELIALHKGKDFHSVFKQINRTDTLLWAIFQNYRLKLHLYNETLRQSDLEDVK